MSLRRSRFSALAIAALLFCASSAARADEDPRRKEADVIYSDGLRLHDLHKEAEALEKFQKAFAIYQSPNILFNVARQEQLLDRPLLAIRHYREAMKSPLLHPTNGSLGKQYVAELETKLGRVEIVGPVGLKVFVVNGPELTLPATEPIDVEPGSVMASGKLGDVRYDGALVASPGRVSRLELKAAAATPRSNDPVVEPPREDPEGGRTATRNLVFGGLEAVGIAGIVVGSVFLSKAASNASDAQPLPSNDPKYTSLKDDYSSNRTAGWIGVGVGGAFLVGGLAAFFFWPKSASSRASLAPTLNGLSGSF